MAALARLGRRRVVLLGTTLWLLLAAVAAAPALAASVTPFQASFDERTTFTSCPSGVPPGALCFVGGGVGEAMPPGGRAIESFRGYVVVPVAGCPIDHAEVTISTRRGNLYLSADGERCPGSMVDQGVWTARGGTGIFAGASGGGTVTTVVKGSNPDGTIISSFSTYNGELTLS